MADMTREAGLEQLQNFLPHMGKAYASKRNFDYGPDAHLSVSRLSGFLRRRLITESEVLNKAMSAHSFTAAEKFIQEIFWRTYFKGWLEMRPTVWMEWSQAKRPDHTHPAYEAAINGRTGIACFDHWSKSCVRRIICIITRACGLHRSGYLHWVCHGNGERIFSILSCLMQILLLTPAAGAGLPVFIQRVNIMLPAHRI